MRVALVVLAVLAVAVPAASGGAARRVSAGAGLIVTVPAGWRLSHAPVTDCADPVQRFVVISGRARPRPGMRIPPRATLLVLMEAASGRFPSRPQRFSLGRLGEIGGCCDLPVGHGAELLFRDHGRRFYGFAYLGRRAPAASRETVERLLDSLRVSPGF